MAKTKKKKGYNDLDRTIAEAEGNIEYGPQVRTIHQGFQDAADQRVSDITAARQSAASAIAFANKQRKPTRNTYATAQNVSNVAAQDVLKAFGDVGAAADPYRAVTAREQGGAKQRLQEEKASALNELTERATGAKAGMTLAINQARSTYNKNTQRLREQLQGVMADKGAYIGGRLAELTNKRASDAADRQLELDKAITDAASDAADKADKKADERRKKKEEANKAATTATNKILTTVQNAIADLNRLANQPVDRDVPDPDNPGKTKPETRLAKQWGSYGKASILAEMRRLGYTSQEIEIARTINRKDRLTPGQVTYIRGTGAYAKRLPQNWFDYNELIRQGRVAGPPSPV